MGGYQLIPILPIASYPYTYVQYGVHPRFSFTEDVRAFSRELLLEYDVKGGDLVDEGALHSFGNLLL